MDDLILRNIDRKSVPDANTMALLITAQHGITVDKHRIGARPGEQIDEAIDFLFLGLALPRNRFAIFLSPKVDSQAVLFTQQRGEGLIGANTQCR